MSFRSCGKWLYRVLTRHKVLITYRINGDRFNEELFYAKLSESQVYSMGYVRGRKIKDELSFLPFRIYVRFCPDPAPLELPAGLVNGVFIPVRETASTLYDHLRSQAIQKFLDDMRPQKLTKMDRTKLLMLAAIAAIAAVGIFIIFMK